MSLLVFIVACGIGALIGLAARPSRLIGRLAVLASLLVAFAAALLIGPTTSLMVGEVTLAGSEFSGFFLACAAGSGLLVAIVGAASGRSDELMPAALALFAGLAVAVTAADPAVALAAGAAGATAGALVIDSGRPRSPEEDGRLAEIRTIGLVTAGLGLAAIAIVRPSWNGPSEDAVFAPAFLGLGVALAIRSGAVPFHVAAARLGRTAVPLSPALLLVWIPAGLGILAVGWSATTFGIQADWLNAAVLAVQVVAVATLVLGPLAALVNDDLDEVVAYSIVADASFVLLAMAARTDDAAEPARLWLVVFVAAKTGLVAWAAALSRAFGTTGLDGLHGWLRRTPLLGLGMVAIVVATLGWPGSPVYEARSTLIRLGLPGGLQFLFATSIVLSVASYGRLLVLGLLSPTEAVRSARSELPRWSIAAARPAAAEATPEQAPAGSAQPGALDGDVATGTSTAAVSKTQPAATATAAVEPAPVASPRRRAESRRRIALAWRLNRTLGLSLVVALGAGLALALALGGLGASDASQYGIPLDTAAHATPTKMPTPTPPPTEQATPLPTFAPRPSESASGEPSGSPEPTGAPSPSPSLVPGTTSGPARDNTE